jgi:hypothetical protein
MHRKRAFITALAAAALAVGVAVPAWATAASAAGGTSARPVAAGSGPFGPGTGKLVVDWNKTLITILGMPGAQPATIHPTRSFAILQGAEYDAVVSITHVGSPFLFSVPVHGQANAAAAADQAAHDVLVALYPAQAETAVANAQLTKELAAIPNGPAKTNGIKVGAAAAAELVAIRSTDGSALTPPPFHPGGRSPRSGPGCRGSRRTPTGTRSCPPRRIPHSRVRTAASATPRPPSCPPSSAVTCR